MRVFFEFKLFCSATGLSLYLFLQKLLFSRVKIYYIYIYNTERLEKITSKNVIENMITKIFEFPNGKRYFKYFWKQMRKHT